MSELLPCPFCGGEAFSERMFDDPHLELYEAGCEDDCAVFQYEKSEEEAVAKWNRRTDDADRARLVARIDELEETLQFAANYKGYEGRACPLCKYENGKFIEHCQMHKNMLLSARVMAQQEKDNARLVAQVAALQAELAEAHESLQRFGDEAACDDGSGLDYYGGLDGYGDPDQIRADIRAYTAYPDLEPEPNGDDVFAGVHPVAGGPEPEPITPEVITLSDPPVVEPEPTPDFTLATTPSYPPPPSPRWGRSIRW